MRYQNALQIITEIRGVFFVKPYFAANFALITLRDFYKIAGFNKLLTG